MPEKKDGSYSSGMRFAPGGPDVPLELVTTHERGEVLFICGAGVSVPAGLPLFRGLVEKVYRELNEDWIAYPAEAGVMNGDASLYGQYDRMLRCLERRVAGSESRSLGRMRVQIRKAVAQALASPALPDLSSHCAVLRLSRDDEGRIRILTTNFDTLFERAGQELGEKLLDSHAGPALPLPRGPGFKGVLHLHGRLHDETLRLTETDLVLTSAEFGDAYLRSGWASRYVYDLARSYALVFVGYGVDDPPMRYLIEALEADRERYKDLRKLYAFAPAKEGEEPRERALWEAKGVEPIFYRIGREGDHRALYGSLNGWADYAEDPTKWRLKNVRTLMAGGYSHLPSEARSELLDLLGHGDAERILREVSPAASWLPILQTEGVFSRNRPHWVSQAAWIVQRIDDEEMIRTCAGRPPNDPDDLKRIAAVVESSKTLSPVYRRAWRFILRSARASHSWNSSFAEAKKPPRGGNLDHHARQAFVNAFRPQVRVGYPQMRPPSAEPDQAKEAASISELVHIEFKTQMNGSDVRSALRFWSEEADPNGTLLHMLSAALEDALNEAIDAGLIGEFDGISRAVRSVENSKASQDWAGFAPLVHLISAMWLRFAEVEPARAHTLATWWGLSSFDLLRRMHLRAHQAPKVFAPEETAALLSSFDDSEFWLNSLMPEIVDVAAHRWRDFSEQDRETLEDRIRRGPPRSVFGADVLQDQARWEWLRDAKSLSRLHQIEKEGGALNTASIDVIRQAKERHPDLVTPVSLIGQPHGATAVWVGPRGDPALLAGTPDEDLVREAIRLQTEGPFDQSDVWRLLCQAEPDRAMRGIHADAAKQRWEPAAWRGLLWAKVTEPSFHSAIAALVSQIPASELKGELLADIVGWLRTNSSALSPQGMPLSCNVLAVWDKLAAEVYAPVIEAQEVQEPLALDDTAALNEPGGVLAWVLVDLLEGSKPDFSSAFTADLQPRFDRVVGANGHAGRLARIYLSRQLPFLHAVAPSWVSTHLLPFFSRQHPEAERLWLARLRGEVPHTPQLFNSLKQDLFAMATSVTTVRAEGRQLAANIILPAIWRSQAPEAKEFDIVPGEVRRVLALANAKVRQGAASLFFEFMRNATGNPAELWRKIVGPFFREVWPKDVNARDSETSQDLAWMALESEEAFPEAVQAVLDVLVPIEFISIDGTLRPDERGEGVARRFPLDFIILLDSLIDPNKAPPPQDLNTELEACLVLDAQIAEHPAFQRLRGIARLNDA